MTRRIRHSLLIAAPLLWLSVPGPASAQIRECAPGVWQNSPCDGQPVRLLPEQPPDPRLDDPDFQLKRRTVTEAYLFQREMRDKHVEFDANELEKQCKAPQMSGDDCARLLAGLTVLYREKAERVANERARAMLVQSIHDAERASRIAAAEAAEAREAAERAERAARDAHVFTPYGF